jgi:hypothetical protein
MDRLSLEGKLAAYQLAEALLFWGARQQRPGTRLARELFSLSLEMKARAERMRAELAKGGK